MGAPTRWRLPSGELPRRAETTDASADDDHQLARHVRPRPSVAMIRSVSTTMKEGSSFSDAVRA